MLRFLALVVHFDRTIAHDGVVAEATLETLTRLRTTFGGRRTD
jgi:hypothetical protein